MKPRTGGGDPLLKLDVLRAPGMTSGLVALAALMGGYGGFLFTFTLHLQGGLGDSALRAGLTCAPCAVAFGLAGYFWRALPGRVHHVLVPAGFLLTGLTCAGIAASLRGGTHGGAWLLVLLVGYGVGTATGFSPLLTQALVGVPRERAADASGLLTTTIQLAQAIGVAVFGTLFFALVGRGGPDASALAVSAVEVWVAVLTLAGLGGAVALARTVRKAAQATPG